MASIMDSVVGECAVSNGHVSITYTNKYCGIYIANKFTMAESHVSVPNIQNVSSVVGERAVSDGYVSITYSNYCHSGIISIMIAKLNKFTMAEAHVSVPNIQNRASIIIIRATVVGECAVSDD